MTPHPRGRSSAHFVAELLEHLAYARYDHDFIERAVDRLSTTDPSAVTGEIERMARVKVAAAWNAGWQPAELARQLRRGADGDTGKLALAALAADHADRDASTLDARWVTQLAELDLPRVAAAPG